MERTGSTWRGPRGLLAGTLCATGTTWAHTALSGHPVGGYGVAALAAVAVASVLGCLLLTRRRLGVPSLILLGAAGQATAHAAMAVAMPAGHATGPAHTAAGAAAHPLLEGGQPMLLAHAVVALLTAVLARCGDAALLDLARQVAHRVVRRLLPVPSGVLAPPTPVTRSATYVVLLRVGRRVEARLGSRGPPAPACPCPC